MRKRRFAENLDQLECRLRDSIFFIEENPHTRTYDSLKFGLEIYNGDF